MKQQSSSGPGKRDLEPDDRVVVLQKTVGARLTSVQFVLDYLILGFDNAGAFTSLVWPKISKSSKEVLTFGSNGYRDGLCDLITQSVSGVEVTGESTVTFSFKNGSHLIIPLREKSGPGERAIFTTPQHDLCVW